MACSCIKGNYQFVAESLDKDTLIYQDASEWMNESGYVVPSEYEVMITPPATSKTYPVTVKVGQLNKLTANDVGFIRDGVYCFQVESCGEKYTRSVLILPKLKCCVKTLWATLEKNRHGEIREIEAHLKSAQNNAELNNVQTASKELKIAKILLENMKCDCNC